MCQKKRVINIDHIPYKHKLANPRWIERFGGIPVDECISDEVENLINSGVITLGCCCGHGRYNPSCLVQEDSIDICRNIGYEPHEFTPEHTRNGIYEIYLFGRREDGHTTDTDR